MTCNDETRPTLIGRVRLSLDFVYYFSSHIKRVLGFMCKQYDPWITSIDSDFVISSYNSSI